MTDKNRRNPPLVADRRYPSKPTAVHTRAQSAKPGAKAPPKPGTAKAKTTTSRTSGKRPPKPPRKRRGGIIGFFRTVFGFILGLIWRITWRVAAVCAILLSLAVLYV